MREQIGASDDGGIGASIAERICAELGDEAGHRVVRCLRTAAALLLVDAQGGNLRLPESAAYNVREALDAVVRDKPAGEGGFTAAMDAWDRYKVASSLPGADEIEARSTLASVLEGLSEDRERQAFMTRRLLEWFREQTGVDPIGGETDPTRQFQELRGQASRIVHSDAPHAQARALLSDAVAWFARFFAPPSEVATRVAQIALMPYEPRLLDDFRSLATSAHHVQLLVERLEIPRGLNHYGPQGSSVCPSQLRPGRSTHSRAIEGVCLTRRSSSCSSAFARMPSRCRRTDVGGATGRSCASRRG